MSEDEVRSFKSPVQGCRGGKNGSQLRLMPSIPLMSAGKQEKKKSLDVQYVQMYSFAFQQETPPLMQATAGVSQTLCIDGPQPCKSRERLLADADGRAAGRRAGPVLRVACNVTGGTLGVFLFPPHFQFCSAAITGRRGGVTTTSLLTLTKHLTK